MILSFDVICLWTFLILALKVTEIDGSQSEVIQLEQPQEN
jgi:hypothetical protein